jgi:MscS family membrane protein
MIPRGAVVLLPGFLHVEIFGQALWQWLSTVMLLVATGLCMLGVAAWGTRHDARVHGAFHRFGQPLAALAIIGLTIYVELLIESGVAIWGPSLDALSFAFEFIGLGACAWLVIALIMRVSEAIIAAFTLREHSFDAQVIRVIAMLLAIFAGLGTVFLFADFIGVPIGPLLGGLGVGGIAVALAVRPTLENVIGGLTLFADRPARVGESCQIGNQSGTIEEIGLRTTKLRRRDDTVVTISNAEVAQARIENLSRRRKTAYDMVLRLRHDTTMEQFQEVAGGIRDLLENHQKIVPGSERVRLSALGEFGLELELRAYIDETPNNSTTTVEELNWGVLAAVRRAGASLAYPSQTNYLVRGERVRDIRPPARGLTQKTYIE